MKYLLRILWNEPAVAFGVVVAAAITAVKLVNGGALTGDDLISMLAPLGTAIGVRPLVTPRGTAPTPARPREA